MLTYLFVPSQVSMRTLPPSGRWVTSGALRVAVARPDSPLRARHVLRLAACPPPAGQGAWRTPRSQSCFLRRTPRSSSQTSVRSVMAASAQCILYVSDVAVCRIRFIILMHATEHNERFGRLNSEIWCESCLGTGCADRRGGGHQEDVLQWETV